MPSPARLSLPLIVLCFFAVVPNAVTPARILGLFPYKGASHFFVFRPLLEELARRGHDVTVVSHLPRQEKLVNYTDISVVNPDDPTVGYAEFDWYESAEISAINNLFGLQILRAGYEAALANPQVLALTNVTFDLVITEMFNSYTFYGLIHKIGAPVIGFSSCQTLTWISDTLGMNDDMPYIPQVVGGTGPGMNFFERFWNSFDIFISRLVHLFYFLPQDQAIAEKYLGPLPNLGDLAANTSLLFINAHFSLLGLRPMPPNVIEVGGINVRKPQPLPEDIDKIYKNSERVIFFSMGSVMKGDSWPAHKEQMIIKAFLQSGRTVLWKRETSLPKEYPNIITRPWFPQRDILAHPKTELFISHCGVLGVNEAVTSGVPILCIPMFGDQGFNAKHLAKAGMGRYLKYQTLNEEEFHSAFFDMMNNRKYADRAKEVSAAFRDRPMSPLDTAVFWTEYFLRHGSQHFEAPFRGLNYWQRRGYDVAAAFAGIVLLIVFAFAFLLKLIFGSKRVVKKEKQS